MASNGLVANPSKTEFMITNGKNKHVKRTVKVGESVITESKSAKLLGITMDKDQKWSSHFTGKNGLIPALTSGMFTIRRLANQIPRQKLRNKHVLIQTCVHNLLLFL